MTNYTAPLPALAGVEPPLLTFKSYPPGKSYVERPKDCSLFPDRLEVRYRDRWPTWAKITLGIFTMGVSFLFTGFYRRRINEVIPLTSLLTVTDRRQVLTTAVEMTMASGMTSRFEVDHQVAPVLVAHLNGIRQGVGR